MNRHRIIAALLITAAVSATPALRASTPEPVFAYAYAYSTADDDYTRGTQALDQQRWQDAVTSFDRVIQAKSKRADAALYWKAYALNKLGRPSALSATCTQLHTTYATSTWNKDCGALTLSVSQQMTDNGIIFKPTPHGDERMVLEAPKRGDERIYVHSSTTVNGPITLRSSHSFEAGSDADLKMLALNSLLQRDPTRAIPAMRGILTSNNSPELKERALSVLGQSGSPEAQALLREVAMGKIAPAEQKRAIQMLGIYQGKRANDTLADIYRATNDPSIKRSVISAFFISGDAQRMVDLARNEKDLQLKHDIVAQLALMHDKAATDYMLELLK